MAHPLSYSVTLSVTAERNSGNSTPANTNIEKYNFLYQGLGQVLAEGKHVQLSLVLSPLQSKTLNLTDLGITNLRGLYIKAETYITILMGIDTPKSLKMLALDFPEGNLGSTSITLSNPSIITSSAPIEVKVIAVGN